jgi:hypothetical protein
VHKFNLLKNRIENSKKLTLCIVVNQEKNGNNNACQASEASSLAATGVASTASAKMEVDGAAATEAAAANGSKSSGGFGGQKAIKKGQISKDESVSDGRGVPSAVARLTQIIFFEDAPRVISSIKYSRIRYCI